jgi:hypothetical protein
MLVRKKMKSQVTLSLGLWRNKRVHTYGCKISVEMRERWHWTDVKIREVPIEYRGAKFLACVLLTSFLTAQ